MPELRADAQRNYVRLLVAAETHVAAHGADASLEAIARDAGVGATTARRHFPTRRALVEAVSHSRIDALGARARTLRDDEDMDGRSALLEWLDLVVDYCVAARGLAAALSFDGTETSKVDENTCASMLESAGEPLLRRAVLEGSVTPDVAIADVIALAVGMALVTTSHTDPAGRARQLFRFAVRGIDTRNAEHASPRTSTQTLQ